MAAPNYQYEKRRRDLEKKAKKEEKRQRKLESSANPTPPAIIEHTAGQEVEKEKDPETEKDLETA